MAVAAAVRWRCLWRVLSPAPPALQWCALPPCRAYAAAAAAAKKAKRGSQKPKQEETKKKRRPRQPLLSKPVDDVYLTWCYERPSYDVDVAIGMLKKFQELDFTYPKQFVYINVTLDMSLQKKKKKVEQFASIVKLPYRFTDETNKVLVFTENKEEAEIAQQNGAALVGGVELIKWILEDEIKMDFYVAVPEIMPKLIPLKSKLRRKYPSARRNSMGQDIPKMLQFFKEGLEYAVQDEHLIKTRIARLDMPIEEIVANLKAVIQDIYTFKPPSTVTFVQKLVIRSSTSEGLLLNLDGLLPQVEKEEEEEEETEEGKKTEAEE